MTQPEEAKMGRTVLIADDDPRLRTLLIWTLEMGQYRVLAAVDGLEALQLAHQHQPDMYALDVGMPGMNGIDVCRQLRAGPSSRRSGGRRTATRCTCCGSTWRVCDARSKTSPATRTL